jgi:uncharacterized SAM-binding protein YcdF (DUF218 family)
MSFFATKILEYVFLDPANLIALLLFGCGLLAYSSNEYARKKARKVNFSILLFVLLIAFFPLGDWILRPLENSIKLEAPPSVDGIVMLSGDEQPLLSETRGVPSLGSATARYLKFAMLAREYPNAKLAFVGGSGYLHEDGKTPNGVIARRVLQALGIDEKRLIVEDKSRTTFENAVNATEIVKPAKSENWLLVTSAFHMPRALACFRTQGWNVFPAPSDYSTTPSFRLDPRFALTQHLAELSTALHEYFGFLLYWLQGKIAAPWG